MKRTILSVAVLVACASQASAGLTARYLLEGDKTFAEDITCAVASNFGIYAHGSGNAGTFTGQTISVDVSEAAGLATGVYAGKGGKIVIGDRDGVPGMAIAACAESAGAEVVFSSTECFV